MKRIAAGTVEVTNKDGSATTDLGKVINLFAIVFGIAALSPIIFSILFGYLSLFSGIFILLISSACTAGFVYFKKKDFVGMIAEDSGVATVEEDSTEAVAVEETTAEEATAEEATAEEATAEKS